MAAGDPVWAVAERFPRQGEWTESHFFALPDGYPRVELSDGRLDVLPMPTDRHQSVLTAVLEVFLRYVAQNGGKALPVGIRVRIGQGRVREPDIAFLGKANVHLRGDVWAGAERHGGGRQRLARGSNARLRLAGDAYAEHGVFGRGEVAMSATQSGLAVSVASIFDAD